MCFYLKYSTQHFFPQYGTELIIKILNHTRWSVRVTPITLQVFFILKYRCLQGSSQQKRFPQQYHVESALVLHSMLYF
jgi:hypothetical protein